MIGKIRYALTKAVLVLGTGLLLFSVLITIDSSESVINVSVANQLFDGILGGMVLIGVMLIGVGVGLVKTRTTKNTVLPEPLVSGGRTEAEDASKVFSGQQFNREYEAVLASGDLKARERVKVRLRNAAIETVSAVEQQPRQEVLEVVLSGDWTDDVVVAAFLGDDTVDQPSLKWQIYAWLYDDRAFEKSVKRSLTQIEQYERGSI
jgi:hypothetical protein